MVTPTAWLAPVTPVPLWPAAFFILGRIEGVDRPALASMIPTEKDPIVLLDVGANVDYQTPPPLAIWPHGRGLGQGILGGKIPALACFPLAKRKAKGNTQVKEAYELFKMAENIDFKGNIEGRDLFTGNVDVVVCDGFVGNVALKLWKVWPLRQPIF